MTNAAMLADDSIRKELYGSVKRKLKARALISALTIESERPPFEATSGGRSSTSAIEPVSRSSRSGMRIATATSRRKIDTAPASAPRHAASSSTSGRRRRIAATVPERRLIAIAARRARR